MLHFTKFLWWFGGFEFLKNSIGTQNFKTFKGTRRFEYKGNVKWLRVAFSRRLLTRLYWQFSSFLVFVSLHIRSMWETICDAQAGFCTHSKFLTKFSRTPCSGIWFQNTPPPWKVKFRQILALWVVDFRIPPPPAPLQIENLGRSWHFEYLTSEYPLPHCWWVFPYVETYIYHTDNILVPHVCNVHVPQMKIV